MSPTWKAGDKVRWQTPQGETHGVVTRVLRERTHVHGHDVNASAAEPRYEVQSEKSGKMAVHTGDALSADARH